MMRRFVIALGIVSLFFATAAFAGESAANAKSTDVQSAQTRARQVDEPSDDPDGALPTISRFQTPGIVQHIGCGDPTSGAPCYDDGGGDGSGLDGCMCSRICWEGNVICHLASSGTGCVPGTAPALCRSCTRQCF